MDAPRFFNEVNHRVNRGHRQRVAADQQRLEGKDLLHFGIGEVLLGKAKQRPDRIEFHKIRHNFQHARDVTKMRVPQLEKPALENRLRIVVETLVTR